VVRGPARGGRGARMQRGRGRADAR